MTRHKQSFFERLTGAISIDDERGDAPRAQNATGEDAASAADSDTAQNWLREEAAEGQLGVDVYQTKDEVVVKTMTAGVRPDDLDITITRDMVSIRGKREEPRSVTTEDYIHKELYWGAFSRTIVLPEEIDPEEAEAVERHGLLIIRLPKLNKDRQTRLKVKSN